MHKDPSIFRILEAVDRFCVSMVSIRFYNLGCSSRDPDHPERDSYDSCRSGRVPFEEHGNFSEIEMSPEP